jgi:hypothetical protein
MQLEFSRQIFQKIFRISNFMKIGTLEAELFNADRQQNRQTGGQT